MQAPVSLANIFRFGNQESAARFYNINEILFKIDKNNDRTPSKLRALPLYGLDNIWNQTGRRYATHNKHFPFHKFLLVSRVRRGRLAVDLFHSRKHFFVCIHSRMA